MIVVYLMGVAGVGKSTTVKQLTSSWSLVLQLDKPFTHRHYATPYGKAIVLGKDVEPFGGTDTFSYTAINDADDFLAKCAQRRVDIVLAEGDRFSNGRFFETASKHGELLLYNLQADESIVSARREQRATQHNKKLQNPTWIEGRKTKVRNLATQHNAVTLNAEEATAQIVERIEQDIHRLREQGTD